MSLLSMALIAFLSVFGAAVPEGGPGQKETLKSDDVAKINIPPDTSVTVWALKTERGHIPIHSEGELREQLNFHRRRKQGLVVLASPHEDRLSISIGGPFVSFGWHTPAVDYRVKGSKGALADRRYTDQSVASWGEGIPTPISPEHLFPVEQVIEAIVYFYNTHEMPRWIAWSEWDPVATQWKVTPAEDVARELSATS